jgi:adenine-specific DNA-methyltransferase
MTKVYKVTHPQGAFWLNLGYLEVPGEGLCVPITYLIWNKSPFYFLQEVVWKYGAGVAAKRRLSPRNEKWLFYVKDRTKYTFNLEHIRDPNVKYPNQKKNGKYRCNPLGKNPSDVWEFPKVTTGARRSSRERTGHPAQFPLRLVERIVRASSNPRALVLDPFAGSCSTGMAAAGLGRLFLGIEISHHYCELAIDRYERFKRKRENVQRQGILFGG